MWQAMAFAIGACFIWGLIFVIPQFVSSFSAMEVALGRYFFYSLISLLIFAKARMQGTCRYPRAIWIKALHLAGISSIGYYTFVVLALRYSTPAVAALILGVSPITIALYGNWQMRECSFKSLLWPSGLILVGLLAINLPHLRASPSMATYCLGLLAGVLSLIAWTWFAVANARFLKSTAMLRSSDWSTLMGVATLFWVLLGGGALYLFAPQTITLLSYTSFDSPLLYFLTGCATLGILCSWVGAFLWNRASTVLPISLAGQLMVFETIFGVLFVYLLSHTLPSLIECLGILLFLAAIIYGIRSATGRQERHSL